MEYSAVNDGYMYVFIRFVHGTKRVCTQCTVCVAWSWCGLNAANAVEYGTEIYGILQFRERYNTAFKNTAKSNIATVAYRTRTVCNTEINDYWYYYGEGTVITRSGSNLL